MCKKIILIISLGLSVSGFSQKILNGYQAPQTIQDNTDVRMLPGFHANSHDGSYGASSFIARIGDPLGSTSPPANIGNTNASSGENYVYTRSYLVPLSTGNANAPQNESITYFDGLGRPKQSIAIKASPSGKDLVTHIEYDGFGRQDKDFLPMPQQGSLSGNIYGIVDQTIGSPLYGGVAPFYSKKDLDNSPLDRLVSSTAPGEWNTQNKKVTFGYETNTATEVKKFVATTSWINDATSSILSQSTNYGAAQLYKNIVTDEDGNKTEEFKNGEGQTLLVRKTEGTTPVDTYYVYNEFNQLAFVIPPLAADKISISTTDLNELCYQYRYDGKGRLVEKKLPGKGFNPNTGIWYWELMVYDKADRLILTQDGNMTLQGKWLITKYDQFGRVAYTGTIGGGSRKSMQDQITTLVITENRDNNGFPMSGTTVYYTNQFFTNIDSVLSVNYYDSYPPNTQYPDADQIRGVDILKNPSTTGISQSTKSLPTASFVKNIEDNGWTKNYTFYDRKGRPIGSHSNNYLGGYTRTESELDFAGVPQKTFTFHKRLNHDAEVKIEENFTYNPYNNALVKHEHNVNNGLTEVLAENAYNEIGQLEIKKVGGSATPLQTVNYKYNVRGWLTDVNNPSSATAMGNDLFAFTIRYTNQIGLATPDPMNNAGLQVVPRFNGNIAEIDWNAVEEAGVPPQAQPYRYGYVYDGLNRLKAGFYQEPNNPGKGTNNEIIDEYDLNGNIKKLKRFAWKAKSSFPAKIDDLTYVYHGNQVTNIADTGNSSGYEGGNGLIEYDINGNMTKMPDKGMSNITYNYLDLPKQITQQNITQYFYRADGVKLRKAYTIVNGLGSNIINTEYLDGFQYVTSTSVSREALQENDDHTLSARTAGEEETFAESKEKIVKPGNPQNAGLTLSFVPTAEGFYDFIENKYIYQYKDHLGNVRLSYAKNNDTDEIDVLDRNDYYPFGMNFVGYHSVFDAKGTPYNYKYNGKELQETGMYDYGARMYMPDIGRWGVVDPLTEKARRFSPYTYASDDPIGRLDPDGRFDSKFGAWLHKTFNGGGSEIRQNADNKQYYYDQRVSNGAESNGGIVMNVHREYGKNFQSSSLVSKTSTVASKTDVIPENPFIKFDATSSTTEGKAGVLNLDTKLTNNISTGKSIMSSDLQLNTPIINGSFEVSPSSVSSGGSISLFGKTSVGASVSISNDIINSDISLNFGQNVGNNTTDNKSVGIKPFGIIIVGASIILERYLPPMVIPQPQFNTVVVPPSL